MTKSPGFLIHIGASLAIHHRVYRLSSTPQREALVGLRLQYLKQRSLAIQALNENIANAEKTNPYLLIVAVSTFVFAEVIAIHPCFPTTMEFWFTNLPLLVLINMMFLVHQLQHSLAPAWKFHMDAVLGIISRWGGLLGICSKAPGMKVPLISFVM